MSWDGSGNFHRSDGTRSGTQVWQDARDAGVNIRADDHDTHDQDIADGLENTVALDGQNTTTTDNAILRFDSGNGTFEGVTVSASEIVGRSAAGDTRGLSAATARQTMGLGTAAPTNGVSLFYSSASSQYVQKTAASARSSLGLGTAAPTNDQALFYSSASSQYVQRSASTARVKLGLGTAAPANGDLLYYASASSQYVRLAKYAKARVSLGGDFDAGDEVVCERFGNTVVITAGTSNGALEHTSSAVPSSSNGAIPSEFRPTGSNGASNVYLISGPLIAQVTVFPGGKLTLLYLDWSGTTTSRSQSNGITITFVITDNIP